jgi:hypothetical protein
VRVVERRVEKWVTIIVMIVMMNSGEIHSIGLLLKATTKTAAPPK